MAAERPFALVALAAALLLSASAAAQNIQILSDEEALALEHSTRFSRMKRWAQTYGIDPEPEFRDYLIPRRFMPPSFPYDVPVLRIVFPENTFFDTASSEVKPSAVPIIRAMAAMLDGDVPDVSVFVAGNADSRGAEVYNHNLSVERARAVARLLNDGRARPTPVWSIGFGKSVPLYPNTSDRNMAFNRRVEFLLASRPDAIGYWLQDQVVDVCRTENAAERVRCMRAFQSERKEFVAEEVAPRRIVAPAERQTRVRPEKPKTSRVEPEQPAQGRVEVTDARQRVRPEPPKQIAIRLNERQVRVQSIEH